MKRTLEDRKHDGKDRATVKRTVKKVDKGKRGESSWLITHISKGFSVKTWHANATRQPKIIIN